MSQATSLKRLELRFHWTNLCHQIHDNKPQQPLHFHGDVFVRQQAGGPRKRHAETGAGICHCQSKCSGWRSGCKAETCPMVSVFHHQHQVTSPHSPCRVAMLSTTQCEPQLSGVPRHCRPSGRAPSPLPLPVVQRVLSLPSRQPWPSPNLLPAEPHTPGTGTACCRPAGSTPHGAPQMQTWKTPAALGARALLWVENNRRESQEVQLNSSW